MKRSLLFSIFLVFFSVIGAQTVDSIKVEQAGEFIKIHYKILNSNQYQTFRVTVFCSINNGLKSELKSLVGDFGENVTGGKPEYIVLWDVLKDVDEVKSVDFSVRAEMLSDNTPKVTSSPDKLMDPQKYWSRERFYILFEGAGSPGYFLAGGRLAFMGNWGFSFSTLAGKKKFSIPYDGKTEYNSTFTQIDISKRILNRNSSQLHVIAGIALGDHEGRVNLQPEFAWGFDLGVVAGLGRTVLYVGYSALLAPLTDGDPDGTTCVDFGLGIRF